MRLATVQGIEFTINADTSSAIDSIKKLSNALSRLQKIGTSDTGLKRVADEIKAFVRDLEKIDTQKLDNLSTAFKGLSSFGNAMSRLSQKPEAINSFADAMERLSGMDFSNLSEAASAIREIVSAAGGAPKNLSETASAASKASSHMGSLAGAAGKLSKMTISKLFDGIKWSASSALGPLRSIGGAISNLASRFKRLLIMRTFRALIRGVVNAFKAGINNLYAWSNALGGEFASSMDRCASAAQYLKNSLGAMVAPLVNALAPALEFVIDKVVTFLNAINQLIARLTGASYWTQATHQATSYGGAVEDAMNGAGSAAKEAMRYLAPFDELNVLPSDSGHGGGGGGGSGGGGSGGSGMFQEMMQFDSNISDFANKLKEAWANADFTEVGGIVGEKLRDALDNIPWDNIKTTCNNIAQSLATFINGFVETPGLWDAIGQTIGEGINTAVGAWNTFFDTTHFDSIGEGISTALNALFDPSKEGQGYINPTELGRSLTQILSAAIQAAYGFLVGGENGEGFDFSNFGTWLGEAFTGAFNNIPLDQAGTALSTALTGLIDGAAAFIKSTNWGDVTSNISGGITSALRTLGDWFQETDFVGMGSDLVDAVASALSGVDWSGIASSLFSALGGALRAAFDFSAGVIFNIGDRIKTWWDNDIKGTSFSDTMNNLWNAFKTGLGDVGTWVEDNVIQPFIDGFFGEGAWDGIKDAAKDIIAGLGDGIADEWRDVKQWVKDHIFTPFLNGLKDAFGIASPATTMNDPGRNIIAGIFQGILDWIADNPILNWLKTNVWDPIVNAFQTLFNNNPIKVEAKLDVETGNILTSGDGGNTYGISAGSLVAGITHSTVQLEGKVDPSFTDMRDKYKSVTDSTATKTATGKQTSVFTSISTRFKEIKSNTATKTITGDKKASFKDAQVAFSGVKSNSATKTLYGAAPASGKFTEAYNAFRSITSNYATKTLYGSAPSSGGFTTAYNAYHSITSDYATKTLYGKAPQNGGFTAAYNAYHSLQDKTVTVTINGRANGVAAGGGYYQWTKAINDGAFATASGTVNEDMLYRAFSRALVDNNVGGDIILDGAVLYKKMVARNTQNTRATGVNAMAAT